MTWRAPLEPLLGELASSGARIEIELPGGRTLRSGDPPGVARVRLLEPAALRALARRDHTALAEAYLDGGIEVTGSMREALRVIELLDLEPSRLARLGFRLRLLLPRRGWNRASIGAHYERDPAFFLPWLERWRSYSHGLYQTPHDAPADAQARKLQAALDALAPKPDGEVLDVGVGWGSFLEFAGLRGVRVHGITLSEAQRRFVADVVRRQRLPCRVECVDFFDLRPDRPLAGAVFMGSLEHLIDYPRVARFLARHLAPGARVWADFCAQRERFQVGAFLGRHVWPGSASYVDVPRLVDALLRAGLTLDRLEDDTFSYACTVRDWADALERVAPALSERFGSRPVRAFELYLRAAQVFFESGRTQAYHLVASRPGPV
jgi:cyclopropane-fatty-acyl-phospholipid synthase